MTAISLIILEDSALPPRRAAAKPMRQKWELCRSITFRVPSYHGHFHCGTRIDLTDRESASFPTPGTVLMSVCPRS